MCLSFSVPWLAARACPAAPTEVMQSGVLVQQVQQHVLAEHVDACTGATRVQHLSMPCVRRAFAATAARIPHPASSFARPRPSLRAVRPHHANMPHRPWPAPLTHAPQEGHALGALRVQPWAQHSAGKAGGRSGASREAAGVKACPGAGQAWPRSMSDTTIPYMATGPCKHRRWRSPGSCRAPHPGWWCPRASSPGPPPWASQQTPQSCGRDAPGGRLANCDLAGMLRPLTRAVLPTASYQWPRPMASCGCAERGDVE